MDFIRSEKETIERSTVLAVARNLAKDKFIKVSLDESVFGVSHVVLVTNRVIGPETNQLQGLLYLNSHHVTFGENGFGYISAAELEKHIVNIEMIDEISATKFN